MNPKRILTQSKITVLTAQEIRDTEELAAAFAQKMSSAKLFTMMANLNAYIWRAAANYKALTKDSEGNDVVALEGWNNLINASVAGKLEMHVAIKYLSAYIVKNWEGAFHSRPALMEYRKRMMSLGLFTYDMNRPEHVATPPLLQKVDIPRMLICYRVFDKIRRDRVNRQLATSENITAFDCMPDHGGMTVITLYNALFFSRGDYQGNYYGDGDVSVPASDEIAVEKPRWKYPKIKGLCRAAWEKLVIRSGEIFDGLEQRLMRAIAYSVDVEPESIPCF